MEQATVTYMLVNGLGGIASMITNTINYRGVDSLPQEVVLLDIAESRPAATINDFGGEVHVKQFAFSKKENWYHLYKRLSVVAGSKPGVLVANDVFEMLMLTRYNIDKKVVQIVHDGYNLQLAVLYGTVVDVFIAHSYFFYEVLCQLFPERRGAIRYIPYGIPLLNYRRFPAKTDAPLKLLFLGRHEAAKGIFTLLEIEKLLQKKGIIVSWLILGKGGETEKLKQDWERRNYVEFTTPQHNREVIELAAGRDILVFPTRFEGFPVALLEAMSVGVVPVATNLPGGLRELVRNGENGFLCELDDTASFADRIEWLHFNRAALEQMSDAAFESVKLHHDAVLQSPVYQDLFKEVADSEGVPKHHGVTKKLGSRLDQPWLPNAVTKLIRKV